MFIGRGLGVILIGGKGFKPARNKRTTLNRVRVLGHILAHSVLIAAKARKLYTSINPVLQMFQSWF